MSSRDPTSASRCDDHSAPSTSDAAPRPTAAPRSCYRRFVPLTTRWMDNDAYGHLNNVVYLSLFDSAVNSALVDAGLLDIAGGEVIGLVVETHCNFFAALAFPQPVEAGLRVSHVGASSIRYEIGIFAAGAAETAARGHFIHVYVDRRSRRPVPLPSGLLALTRELQ
jgi:acyl-CoA thioester hydrolase